jgi:hypothetical protein
MSALHQSRTRDEDEEPELGRGLGRWEGEERGRWLAGNSVGQAVIWRTIFI